MTTKQFIKEYNPCRDGKKFAEQFDTMSEVWEKCKKSNWMFWILSNHRPLTKERSVRLAIEFAELALVNWKDKKDNKPTLAIEAASEWLKNPTEENRSAAESAARSAARSAAESAAESAESAESAAWSAAWSARSARSARSAAWSAARSAESAAWSAGSAAWSAARSARSAARSARSAAWSAESAAELVQCNIIRLIVPNPFTD